MVQTRSKARGVSGVLLASALTLVVGSQPSIAAPTVPPNQTASVAGLAASAPVLSESHPVKDARYGLFVHYVPGLTVDQAGNVVADLNTLANSFNATDFAEDLEDFGVDYVKFTAWHKGMFPLYPSAVMTQYRGADASAQRDVISAMIDTVSAKGIPVVLYTHPRDGHDMSHEDQLSTGWARPGTPYSADPNPLALDFQAWNDFVYASYDELLARYADRLAGIYIDEGDGSGQSQSVVDYLRLKTLIRSYSENLLVQHNFFGSIYSADIGDKEYSRVEEFASTNGRVWPSRSNLSVSPTVTPTWWTSLPATQNAVVYSAADMYRYSILQGSANLAGGGVSWAAGPYPGGGWESGFATTMTTIGGWRTEVSPSLARTLPSRAWPTPNNATVNTLPWGGVAVRSRNDHIDYLHVFDPPAGNTLTLPAPVDGRVVKAAVMLRSGATATVQQSSTNVTVTLPTGESWHSLDTVIALHRQVVPASVDLLASSTVENTDWGTAKAVDGLSASRAGSMGYSSSSSESTDHAESFTLDLGSVERINHITVQPRTDGPNAGHGMPRSGKIEVSTDGTNWTTVDSFVDRPVSPESIDVQFTTRGARFVRLSASSLRANPNDSGRFRLQFAEIGVRRDDRGGTGRLLTDQYHSRQLQGTGNQVAGSAATRYVAGVPMNWANAEVPWTITETSPDIFVLTNAHSGLRLEDSGAAYGGRSDVTVVVQNSNLVSDAQRWRIEAAGTDGWVRLINVQSGRALHMTGNPYLNRVEVRHVVAVPASWLGAEQRWWIH